MYCKSQYEASLVLEFKVKSLKSSGIESKRYMAARIEENLGEKVIHVNKA